MFLDVCRYCVVYLVIVIDMGVLWVEVVGLEEVISGRVTSCECRK